MTRPRSAITASDVARKAGVSRSAVSRAFTPSASIDPARRSHILHIAEQLGYRPNALARSLVKSRSGGRTGLVAVVMGEFNNPFQPYFFAELTRALQAQGQVPMLIMVDDQRPYQEGLGRLMAYQVDAAIIAAGSLSPDITEAFLSLNIPAVLLGRESQHADVPAILTDNHAVGVLAAHYVLRKGCQAPAYIAGREDGQASCERQQGFLSTLEANGTVAVPVLTNVDYSQDSGYRSAEQLLRIHPEVDGVFCACDALALGALMAFRAAGIAVPSAMHLVGCDDVPQADALGIHMTTIAQPVDALVEAAMGALKAVIAGETVAPSLRLPPRFIQRDT